MSAPTTFDGVRLRRRHGAAAHDANRIRLGVVSTYPPHPGALARFTADLAAALARTAPEIAVSICAVDVDGLRYPRDVAVRVDGADPSDYPRAGRRLDAIGVDVALVEYRFDTFGGPHGRYVLGLTDQLRRLNMPYIVMLHGIGPRLTPARADAVRALCRDATYVTTWSDGAAGLLTRFGLVAANRLVVLAPPSEVVSTVATLVRVGGGRRPTTGADRRELTLRQR